MSGVNASKRRPPEDVLLEHARALALSPEHVGLFARLRDVVARLRAQDGDAAADAGLRKLAKIGAAAMQGAAHACKPVVPISEMDRAAIAEFVRTLLELACEDLDDVSHEVLVEHGGDVTVTTRVADPSADAAAPPIEFTSKVGPDDVAAAARELRRRSESEGSSFGGNPNG